MVLAGVNFWYDNYGLWPWQAKPRPKTVWSLLMKLGKWIDEKVEILHVLLFFSSTINFGCYVSLVSVPLTYNGRNCGSCNNLNTAKYFLMKLNKWIGGKVGIMHVLSFC